MSTRKERLTVTVDPHLIEAGNDAVSEGRAESLSAWVNAALTEKIAKERRLAALADAVAAYEARFGAISVRELDEQRRADRQAAVVVRGKKATPPKRGSRRGRTA
jgi:Arc/MetJ-type ribon-helix-helix transcriptional regulator